MKREEKRTDEMADVAAATEKMSDTAAKSLKKRGLSMGLIVCIAALVLTLLAVGGYQLYRYPGTFRGLSDKSLGDAQVEEFRNKIMAKDDKKCLVAYFSYSGTTERVAEALSEALDSDIYEIVTANEYDNVYTESNAEIRKNERPELVGSVDDIDEYDIVFVGYPVWWHATPAPVNTFLENYDFTDKLIIPFCTSGGSDIDETMPTFLDSCEDLAVYGERRITGTGDIEGWLRDIGFKIK